MVGQIKLLLTGIIGYVLISCQSDDKRPNILFIMSDDHAVNAIGCYGKRLSNVAHTPNIDQLSSQGMLFKNCFATNSICSPSRATILTGKYSHKNGVYCLNQNFPDQPTSASILQSAGYQTAIFGKWHLKSTPTGFDEYKVLREQGRYQNPEFVEKNKSEMTEYEGWSEDIISDMTIDFLKNREKDKPFFVMAQYKGAHDPWASRPPFDTLYQNMEIPEPDNLCDQYIHRTEASKRTTLKLDMLDWKTFHHEKLDTEDTCLQRKHVYQQYIKAYLRSAAVMDANVGKLLKLLKQEGLDKNTIVIYTSDQGHFLGEHGFFSKRFMYDESMQMPLIIRYPGYINPGSENEELIANVDVAPTIVDLAGVNIPEDMQGQSIKGFLLGNPPENWREAIYYRYWQHLLHRDVAAHYGIRTKDYKLIYYYGLSLGQTEYSPTPPEWELFDLKKDPNEMVNVYKDQTYKQTVSDLKQILDSLKIHYDDEDSQYPQLKALIDI